MHRFAVSLYIIPRVFVAPAADRSSDFGAPLVAECNYTTDYNIMVVGCAIVLFRSL